MYQIDQRKTTTTGEMLGAGVPRTRALPYDLVMIGEGLAGLAVALRLPAHLRVALLTKGKSGERATLAAQRGLTGAWGCDERPELHLRETPVAGTGLCDIYAARVLTEEAPAAGRWLITQAVPFDLARPTDPHANTEGGFLECAAAHKRWSMRPIAAALRRRDAQWEHTYQAFRCGNRLDHGACTQQEGFYV